MNEYCVDLKVAKQLKETGFPQTSVFRCQCARGGVKESILLAENPDQSLINQYCLPCSDEVLKELPHQINGFWLRIDCNDRSYSVGYWESGYEDERIFEHFSDLKLANALALLWIYLKKEGYIK